MAEIRKYVIHHFNAICIYFYFRGFTCSRGNFICSSCDADVMVVQLVVDITVVINGDSRDGL